ncbi:MAG: hypothetical protein LBG59_07395 [Candidatus Peribacteria bacterium]|jgi:hypothetical protein|nr:hypothetical protein [Candidatus Peribacteria bacterium]
MTTTLTKSPTVSKKKQDGVFIPLTEYGLYLKWKQEQNIDVQECELCKQLGPNKKLKMSVEEMKKEVDYAMKYGKVYAKENIDEVISDLLADD